MRVSLINLHAFRHLKYLIPHTTTIYGATSLQSDGRGITSFSTPRIVETCSACAHTSICPLSGRSCFRYRTGIVVGDVKIQQAYFASPRSVGGVEQADSFLNVLTHDFALCDLALAHHHAHAHTPPSRVPLVRHILSRMPGTHFSTPLSVTLRSWRLVCLTAARSRYLLSDHVIDPPPICLAHYTPRTPTAFA